MQGRGRGIDGWTRASTARPAVGAVGQQEVPVPFINGLDPSIELGQLANRLLLRIPGSGGFFGCIQLESPRSPETESIVLGTGNMTISKWLQLNEDGGRAWVLPIWTAVNQSGRSDIDRSTKRFGYFASLKMRMIGRQRDRLNEELKQLFKQAKQHEERHICTPQHPMGDAFRVDDELKYRLMLDNDLILFEIDSCSELMRKFLSGIYRHLGKTHEPKKMGKEMERILRQKGHDPQWFVILDKERNFFAHEGAPYHAIDISKERFGLIIMKRNLKVFDDPEKFITLAEVNAVIKGFFEAADLIKEHILDLYGKASAHRDREPHC